MFRPLRALLVEQDVAAAEAIVQEIRRAGFQVKAQRVQSEPSFVAQLEPTPDLIILDDSATLQVQRCLRRLNERGIEVPIIVVSDTVKEDDSALSSHPGVIECIAKNQLSRLGPAVTQALAQRRVFEVCGANEAGEISEPLFRDLVEKSLVGIYLIQDGRYAYVNPKLAEIFGYSVTEILAMASWIELVSDPDRELASEQMRRRFSGEAKSAHYVYRGRRKDGSIIDAEVLGSVTSFRGRPAVVGTLIDVSEARQRGEALREGEERFQNAFEHTGVAMVLTDLNHRFIRANQAFAELFGYSQAEILALSMPEITHSADLAESHKRREDLLAGKVRFFQMEKRYLHKDGRIIWALTNVSLIRDAHGRPQQYVGQVQDITERKRIQDALAASEQRLRHVVSSSPAVLYSVRIDADGMSPTWISDNIEALLGYSAAESMRLNWWLEHLHEEDRQRVATMWSEPMAARHAIWEYRLRHRDGSYRWIQDEKRFLVNESGQLVECVGSWSDISERKNLEDQFRQAQKMEAIGRLAGGVAHDFNNLLTVINGYSDLMCMKTRPQDPLHGMAEQIRSAGERAARLTRQLLAFSRKQILVPVSINLNEQLAGMTQLLTRLIGEDIELQIKPAPDLWPLKADPGQIEQVIMNIVINARDAMPTGGKLTIETHNLLLDQTYASNHAGAVPGEYVRLAISDSGCGMDESTRRRIFEPFFSTKGERGTGLGLATVFGIVKQSNGHIEVYSEVGIGTTFKVYLPRDLVGRAPKVPIILEGVARGTETILLAEDDADVRGMASLILRQNGYTVLEARNGSEALQHCETHRGPVHLLLTDVVMPNMGGRQLADHLRVYRPEAKVLFLSGYTDEAIVHQGVLDPGTPFLQKPYSFEGLLRKVREVLHPMPAST